MNKAAAKNIAIGILCLSIWAITTGFTVDAPHGPANGYSCTDCHTGHATLGSSGFNNICLSCHRVGVPAAGRKPFSLADQADPFGSYTAGSPVPLLQTSHRWEGTDTVPWAGAQPPLFPALTSVRSRTGGNLACIRCHSQHDNSLPPFLRMANDRDQLCLDCHRSRDRRDQALSGTHPVNFGYLDPGSKAVLNPSQYQNPPLNANPANPSSDLGANFKGGKLLCSSCHRVHYADSSSATYDSYSSYNTLAAGDGNLLRTDPRGAPVAQTQKDNLNICTNCHAGKSNHNYRGQDIQCIDCHGAHVDTGDGSAPNSFLIWRFMNSSSASGKVRNRPVFSRATSAMSANFVDPSGTGVCQACHTVPLGVADKHSLTTAKASDCRECHYHDNALGSFSGGCSTCHGYPITATTIGGPLGLATPATGVLGPAPASPGAHGTHVTSKAIQCLSCHSGYTANPMGNGKLEMGFGVSPQTWNGFTGHVNSGTIFVNSSLNSGYSWGSSPGTTLVQAPGQAISCSVYCHGTTLSGGSNNQPVWTGSSQAFCGSCHGASAALPPTTGNHLRHAGNGTNNLALSCATCHGDVSGKRHVNGTVLWDLTLAGSGAGYRGAPSGSTGTLAPSASYGQCSSVYCHSSVQGAAGAGAPASFATPVWGGTPLACNGCHQFDMTAAGATGSHNRHFTSTIWTGTTSCASCHFGAGGGTPSHANGNIEVAFASQGSYSQSPNLPGNGYGSCSGISCHAGSTVTWGSGPLPADCTGCHGNDAASSAPLASGAHRSHMNNFSTLGRGNAFACSSCHAGTVNGNRNISTVANHINGVKNYSGARTGRIAVPGSGSCTTSYCHSDGKGSILYWNMTAANWYSGRKFDCSGCHGGVKLPDGTASGFPSTLGEPNYTNSGPGTPYANSHKKHVFDAGIIATTGCVLCHRTTVDSLVPGKLRDYSSAHLDGVRTLRFKVIGGVQGRYSSATQQCNNTYCHSVTSPRWGGSSFTCNGCHQANSALPGQHARHWESAQVATSYVAAPGNAGSAGSYQFSCSSCHATPAIHAGGPVGALQTAEIYFSFTSATRKGSYAPGATGASDGTLRYSFGSCSSTYCHSNGNGADGNNTSFSWDPASAPLGCTGCHGAAAGSASAIATGRHSSHVSGYGFSCAKCHGLTVDATGTLISDKTKHVNKVKDVAFDAFNPGGTYLAQNCSATYCHSPGTSFSAPYPAPATAATWNGTLPANCSGCHGGLGSGPNYANGTPKANSHATHVVVGGQGCQLCHATVTSDGTSIANKANHASKSYQVAPGAGVSFSATLGTPGAPTACSDISCHGGTGRNAVWGATLACQDCHLTAAADLEYFTVPFTTASPAANINLADWTGTGHGRSTGSYRSGNPAARLSCQHCHDAGVGHNVAANWFRFLNYSSVTWGRNQVCQSCHATGAAGVTAGGATVSSALKIGSAHYGPKHGTSNSGGQFCWDCHDPHGDINDYMIHAQVAAASDRSSGAPVTGALKGVNFTLALPGATAWGDFVKASPAFNGICQVCHKSLGTNLVNHFTSTSFDATHNPGSSCIGCHSHNGPTPTLAFQPAGGGGGGGSGCNSCHGYPPASPGFAGTKGNWSSARIENYQGGGGAHTVAKHVKKNANPAEGFANCDRCHSQADHQTSPVQFQPSLNIKARVNSRFAYENAKLARYSSNRLDGAAHVTGNCSSINCHFGTTPKWDPSH